MNLLEAIEYFYYSNHSNKKKDNKAIWLIIAFINDKHKYGKTKIKKEE